MSKRKVKFTPEHEEKLINFVKFNEILYNVKDERFRDSEARHRLWLQIAYELSMDVEVVKQKWKTMRDYFVRTKKNKTFGSPSVSLSKRDESLSFLLETSNISRSPKVTAVRSSPSPDPETQSQVDSNDTNSDADDCFRESVSPVSNPQTPNSMMTRSISRESSPHRPKSSDFKPEIQCDDIQQFFDSMASTVRKFTPLSIVRIKNKIAQIVGEEEIAWAEKAVEFRSECKRAQTLLRQSFGQKEPRTQKSRRHNQGSDNSFTEIVVKPKNGTPSASTSTKVSYIIYPEGVDPFKSVKFKTAIDRSTNYDLSRKVLSESDIDEDMIPITPNGNSDEEDNKSIEAYEERLIGSDLSDDEDRWAHYNDENIQTVKRIKKSPTAEKASKISTESSRVPNKTDHKKGERSKSKQIRNIPSPDFIASNSDKNIKYICELCGQTFTLWCYFQMHVNRHNGKPTFPCELCPEKFFTQQSLTRHILKHAGAKPNACRYCPRRFLDYSAKMRHERMHTNDRPCKCPYCGKGFTRNYILKSHLLSHIGERTFSCETCQRSFIQKKSLLSHCKTITHKQNVEKEKEKASK